MICEKEKFINFEEARTTASLNPDFYPVVRLPDKQEIVGFENGIQHFQKENTDSLKYKIIVNLMKIEKKIEFILFPIVESA